MSDEKGDFAFKSKDTMGMYHEMTYGGALSFLRRKYSQDLSGVDVVRDKIKGFSSSMGFKKWKIVFLDESDYLTPNAQAILRNLMETFSTSTRFILTCNYIEKIIEPIQSRCQMFEIIPPSKKEVIKRMKEILNIEKVKYDMGDLET